MYDHTRLDRMRSKVFMAILGVAPVSWKIREGRLRWFEHVRRREQTAPVKGGEPHSRQEEEHRQT